MTTNKELKLHVTDDNILTISDAMGGLSGGALGGAIGGAAGKAVGGVLGGVVAGALEESAAWMKQSCSRTIRRPAR